ncbi:MAG: hypothetical protein ACYDG2_15705, partial [Ruminiclostridium sp.]
KPVDENTERLNYRNSRAYSQCDLKDKCTKSKNGRVIARSTDQDFLDTVDERNMKRTMNILGVKEIAKKLEELLFSFILFASHINICWRKEGCLTV